MAARPSCGRRTGETGRRGSSVPETRPAPAPTGPSSASRPRLSRRQETTCAFGRRSIRDGGVASSVRPRACSPPPACGCASPSRRLDALGAAGCFLTAPYELDLHLDPWNPTRQSHNSPSLTDPYACDDEISSDGNCRNFWYEDVQIGGATIRSFNLDDDGGYGQTAFASGADNSGQDVGCDFLEQSLAYTNGDCTGALYYR